MTSTKKGKAANATKEGPKPSKVLNRPPTRTIVRWNDELDKKLLLSIQSACNKHGVRVPWGEVANMMQNNITDGAIVQHLAKLRTRMVDAGMEVPPPLRRAAGSLSKSAETEEAPAAPNPAASGKANTRKKAVKRSLYDSGDESFDDGKKSNKKSSKNSLERKGKDSSNKGKGKAKSVSIKSEDGTEDSGIYGFQATSDTESNENVDREFVATGEEYASFKYEKAASVNTPSSSEPSHQDEHDSIQEASNSENAACPIPNSMEVSAVPQFFGGTGEHTVEAGEVQAPFATEAIMNGQYGVPSQYGDPMGIDQAVPPVFAPHHNMHNFPAPSTWPEDPTGSNHSEMSNPFELNDFGFIHGATDQNVAFTRGFQASSIHNQFSHGSHSPFIPMNSAPMGSTQMSSTPMGTASSAPMNFTIPSTSLAHPMMEDVGSMQEALLDPDFSWAFDASKNGIENSFDELIQQMSTD